MRTEYALLHREGTSHTSRETGRYGSVEVAMAAAGHPQPSDWEDTPAGVLALSDPALQSGGYANDLPWMISERQVPETDAERIRLATELILEDGQVDGDHHKTWVIDQVLRLLTGSRYRQVIEEYCAGEDGAETYSWDEGIAP